MRRTDATNLQRLGVKLEVTEAVLNHVSGSRAGIVGVYQRHEYAAEKRAALEAWGRYLDGLVSGAPAGNVVRFAGGARQRRSRQESPIVNGRRWFISDGGRNTR